MKPPIDPTLVEAVQRGDTGALGSVLEASRDRLYNVCLRTVGHRDDAAELTQDTMLKVIQHIGEFRGQSDLLTWMTRIAMNLSLSHLRKRKLRKAASLDSTPDNGDGRAPDDQSSALRQQLADTREPPPDQGVQQKETAAQLVEALARLDDEFRAILVLRDVQEMDYQQIAQVLGAPVGTVKSRLFRARLALRHEMLAICPPPSAKAMGPREVADG